jgi:hypothetical protein
VNDEVVGSSTKQKENILPKTNEMDKRGKNKDSSTGDNTSQDTCKKSVSKQQKDGTLKKNAYKDSPANQKAKLKNTKSQSEITKPAKICKKEVLSCLDIPKVKSDKHKEKNINSQKLNKKITSLKKSGKNDKNCKTSIWQKENFEKKSNVNKKFDTPLQKKATVAANKTKAASKTEVKIEKKISSSGIKKRKQQFKAPIIKQTSNQGVSPAKKVKLDETSDPCNNKNCADNDGPSLVDAQQSSGSQTDTTKIKKPATRDDQRSITAKPNETCNTTSTSKNGTNEDETHSSFIASQLSCGSEIDTELLPMASLENIDLEYFQPSSPLFDMED